METGLDNPSTASLSIAELKPLVIAALLKAPGSSTFTLATQTNGERKRVEDILRRLRNKGLVQSVLGQSQTPKGRYQTILWSPTPALAAAYAVQDKMVTGLRGKVLAILSDGQPRTAREIAALSGVLRETVRTCCRRMTEDGHLISTIIKNKTYWRQNPQQTTGKPKPKAKPKPLPPLPNVPWIHPIRARALGLTR